MDGWVAELKLCNSGRPLARDRGRARRSRLAASRYLGANPSGLALWRALAAGAWREELVATAGEAFEMAPELAGADVDRFIDEVAAFGLLEG